MACEGRGEIPTVLRSAAVLKESDKGAPINPVSIERSLRNSPKGDQPFHSTAIH